MIHSQPVNVYALPSEGDGKIMCGRGRAGSGPAAAECYTDVQTHTDVQTQTDGQTDVPTHTDTDGQTRSDGQTDGQNVLGWTGIWPIA